MSDLNMECYPEEEEEVPIEEGDNDDDDSDGEIDECGKDADPLERDIVIRGQRPHLFEPLARNQVRENETENDSEPHRDQWRNRDPTRLEDNEWCLCGHCQVMPSFEPGDCICCREIDVVASEADRQQVVCITTADAYEAAILNEATLYIAWQQFTERWRQHAKSFGARNNEKYRYTAYRQFVRWCWGWLGRHIRVQLPACVQFSIKSTYPDGTSTYKGTILRRLDVN